MAFFKCKMCGGELELVENSSSCTCDFCGTQQTIPTVKDESLQGLFNRANVLRMKSEFDKAEEIYEKIIQASETEAEAYWGLILCKYGIEYVEDPVTYKRIPTCHRASYESITADEDYKSALAHADIQQKMIYEEEAKAIEEVQKGIMALVANEKPYDVFICYKETDENGKRTQDSVIANDIYYQLTQEGFKVFYAAITLEDKLGTEYEPYIFSALNTAKVMLSLGTKPEYFNAVWVKNEWSRFLKIMKKDRSKMLIPCYRDMDAYELPEEFAHLQAQDMSKIGFINDIVRGIKKVVVKDETTTQKETVVVQQAAAPVNSNIQALLDRGNMAIEDGEWEKADGFFEEVLNQDAKCAQAYLGKLLARERKSSFDAYIRSQCNRYKDANSEKLEACPEDTAAINNAINQYAIDNYVEPSEISRLFTYDRTYSSRLSARKQQQKEQLAELEQDKILNRLKQYMSGDLADMVNNGLTEIGNALTERIHQAKTDDDHSVASIKAAYSSHTASALNKAKELYDKACEKRERVYQGYLVRVEEATSITAYESIIDDFKKIQNYKDVNDRIAYCNQEIDRIKDAEAAKKRRAKAKKKRIMAISAIMVVAAICLYLVVTEVIIPPNKYSDAQKALVEGRYEDAITGFTALGDYKDAADKVLESQYLEAESLFTDGKWTEAAEMYKGLADYKEAADKRLESVLKAWQNGLIDYIIFGNRKWLVLEQKDGKALLLSKEVIEKRAYEVEWENTTWELCSLRKWLNNDYLNSAFDEAERRAIVEVNIANNDNPKYGTAGGNDTVDKIFLLSIEEVNTYFSTYSERIALDAAGETAWWWLRSPGNSSRYAADVYHDGYVDGNGYDVNRERGAVRPALWIDISNLSS